MCDQRTEDGRRRTEGGRRLFAVLCLLFSAFWTGCGYYSLTGAEIPAHLNTVAVPLVESRTAGGVPDLERALTDAFVDRFADRTRLTLEPDEEAADAVVRAAVVGYTIEPVAVTGEDVASLNRVTVVLDVRFEDRREERDRLARQFRAQADFDPSDLAAGEAEAAARAVVQLADDVFTAAMSDF